MDVESSLTIYCANGGTEIGEIVLITDLAIYPGMGAFLGCYALLPDQGLCSDSNAEMIRETTHDKRAWGAIAFERSKLRLLELIQKNLPEAAASFENKASSIPYVQNPQGISELIRKGQFLYYFQNLKSSEPASELARHLAESGSFSGMEGRALMAGETETRKLRDELARLQRRFQRSLLTGDQRILFDVKSQILAQERKLAQAEGTEYAVPLSGCEWGPAPGERPLIWSDARTLWMLFAVSDRDGKKSYRTMKFNDISGHRSTSTSDSMEEVALSGRGLDSSAAMEVCNSKWLWTLRSGHEESPYGNGRHHYVFCFWDSMVEVVARFFEQIAQDRSLEECIAEVIETRLRH